MPYIVLVYTCRTEENKSLAWNAQNDFTFSSEGCTRMYVRVCMGTDECRRVKLLNRGRVRVVMVDYFRKSRGKKPTERTCNCFCFCLEEVDKKKKAKLCIYIYIYMKKNVDPERRGQQRGGLPIAIPLAFCLFRYSFISFPSYIHLYHSFGRFFFRVVCFPSVEWMLC